MDKSVDNSNLCLIGKIMVPKLLNKQAVSRIILGAWKTRVENEDDKALVLKTAPWSIMGNLLVHGLPMDKMTTRNGQIIGESIRKPIGVEAPNDGLLLSRSFLRIRVEVSFKYERLSDFCYNCGRIGHDKDSCKFVSRETGRQSGYGPEMRTGVARNISLPVEFYWHQIEELEDRLHLLLQRNSNAQPGSGVGLRAKPKIDQTSTTGNGARLPLSSSPPTEQVVQAKSPLRLPRGTIGDTAGVKAHAPLPTNPQLLSPSEVSLPPPLPPLPPLIITRIRPNQLG
ncbi:hypothetical protein ACSBR2_030892 [Camellia fascicularis]